MKITQIRNATVRLEYAGKVFLIDPWLMERGEFGVLKDTPYQCVKPEHETIAMPIHSLPMPVEDILAGVDAFVLTHIHPDHLDMNRDGTIRHTIPLDRPIFVQSVDDAHVFLKAGYTDITVMYANSALDDINLIKAPARHGTKIPCGPACGVVFKAPAEKTLYVVGDSIWYDGVLDTLNRYQPDVVIVNACAATLKFYGRLIMNDEDVEKVHQAAPYATIIVSHMDNVAHATINREDMRRFVRKRNLEKSVLIPADGEVLDF